MTRPSADPYAILGIPRDASRDEAAHAYRRLAKLHHPDQSTEADSQQRMQRLNEAWAIISDPLQRARYDEAAARRASAGRPRWPAPGAATEQPATTTWAGAWPSPRSEGNAADDSIPVLAGAVMVVILGLLLFGALTVGFLPSLFLVIGLAVIARGVIGAFDVRSG